MLRWLLAVCPLHCAADFLAPQYVVDLDAPALQRWGPLLKHVIEAHGWEGSYAPVVDHITKILPFPQWQNHDLALQSIGLGLFGLDYFEEIKGAHAAVTELGYGNKMTAGMLVFLQLFYELQMECTGILTRDSGGNVIHGRNMDIDLPVANITAEVTWTKNGEEVMVTTQYLGYFGVHTGMRKGSWSVQANERFAFEPGPWGWQKTVIAHDLLSILEGRKPVGYLIRESLLSVSTFGEAVQRLSSEKTVSWLYFVVAGAANGEGVVITRNREGLADNPKSLIKLTNDTQSIVQTNWDNWIPIDREQCLGTIAALPAAARGACRDLTKLIYGDPGGCEMLCNQTSDGRAEAARVAMKMLRPGSIDVDHVMKVLSTPPVLAPNTGFTSVMVPHNSAYKTIVREHKHSVPHHIDHLGDLQREQLRKVFKQLVQHAAVTV